MCFFSRCIKIVCVFIFLSALIGIPDTAEARVVDDVRIEVRPDGFQIRIDFSFLIFYESHTPPPPGQEIHARIRPINLQSLDAEDIDLLRERMTLSWDQSVALPLKEITFEGGDTNNLELIYTFTKDVEYHVSSTPDLRSIIVDVKTEMPAATLARDILPTSGMDGEPGGDDAALRELMDNAKDELTNGRYSQAIQLYTKVLRTAQGPLKQEAQEYLGLSREKNGQLAHAKFEYQTYLVMFPEGPGSDRVRQRLAGLITAAKTPKEPLKGTPRKKSKPVNVSNWQTRAYGNLFQFYYYDQTNPENGEKRVNIKNMMTNLNLYGNWKSKEYEIRSEFNGSYTESLMDGADDARISNVTLEFINKLQGWSGKVGRQNRSSGGILGRFDGFLGSYNIGDNIVLSGVFGFPVNSTGDLKIETDKKMFGLMMDWKELWEGWDANAFYNEQSSAGLVDRRAIGGEVHYFDPQKSFFGLVDYDVFYDKLNILLFNGRVNPAENTTLNLTYDYRKSPVIMTTNAMQGQGVENLEQLTEIFSADDIYRLAEDRTAESQSATLGVTQDFNKNLQVTADITLSELEGTPSSGGVEGMEGTGVDISYQLQMVNSNLFMENDTYISGIRYSDTHANDLYSVTLNARIPYQRNLRFTPRLRFDFRKDKEDSDKRFAVRPSLRVDYSATKSLQYEVEFGTRFTRETSMGVRENSTDTFFSIGCRINF